jgi:hypothetical protein
MPIRDRFNPQYTEYAAKWEKNRDCFDGQDKIKSKRTVYLPMTSGQLEDSKECGGKSPEYDAYLARAVFPPACEDSLRTTVGLLHREPSKELMVPERMARVLERATPLGESMDQLLRNINVEQLITGRIGLMGDFEVDEEGVEHPVIITYKTEDVMDWEQIDITAELKFTYLREEEFRVGFEADGDGEPHQFQRKKIEVRRTLFVVETEEQRQLIPNAEIGDYVNGVITEEEGDDLNFNYVLPQVKGQSLKTVPFVFVNTADLNPRPEKPPLDALCDLSLTIYRGEADYRQNLFMQGQDTLVISDDNYVGNEERVRVGAGASLKLGSQGKAGYVGVNSNGLTEQRIALENDHGKANQKAGQLLDATSRAKESGDALRVRVSAQTANLPEIATTAAAGVENLLKLMAPWFGVNPDEISITPNLDFVSKPQDGQTLLNLQNSKIAGVPISEQSIHRWATEQGFTEMRYEDEIKLAKAERAERIKEAEESAARIAENSSQPNEAKTQSNTNDQ